LLQFHPWNRFADAKVLLFFELPRIFATFFIKNCKIHHFLLVICQKGTIFAVF